MSKTTQTNSPNNPSHNRLWGFLLLPLLAVVLFLGLYIILFKMERFPYLLGIAAFSIAYALHFFAVSIALCGVYIREDNDNRFERLRQKERRIVTSAMYALAGGLGILFAGGLCAIGCSIAVWFYAPAAILLFVSVLKYVLFERGWPREVRDIRKENTQDTK
ncbi:MAG: hypothetical protein A3C36_04845 [Omnitrophica WOR_2 bacterium RIFCSPHIGHO2_02_FULL_52_10]|nr:MAG: hypothetical protein A3C36_04845 [Omnitrophica WOR_2 bacterium RIFCSPHIGHO2_02_FULL_52_10]